MDRTAVITGAASGIGLDVANRLASLGWRVTGMDLSFGTEAAFDQAARPWPALHCDVSDPVSVQAAFAQFFKSESRIDALICCAGIQRPGRLVDMSIADVDALLGVNIRGPLLAVRQALPGLREAAVTTVPNVVMLGSVSGLRPKVGTGMYAASKAALHVLIGVLAVELAGERIRVNGVAPGTTDTPMIRPADARSSFKLSGVSPMGRIGTPADVTAAIELLLDPRAAYVTGVVLPVDGGTRAAHVG